MDPSPEAAKQKIRQRYDQAAGIELTGNGRYENPTSAKLYFRSRKLQTALRLGSFQPGDRLLEIGCAVGHFTFPLAQLGYRIIGLDFSENCVAAARQRIPPKDAAGIRFIQGDAEDLGLFDDGSFDGVLSLSTLRYVPHLSKALKEIHRVLRPGGRAVLDFPNRWCPWFYLKPWLGSERHPYDHWFMAKDLQKELKKTGLQPYAIQRMLFTPTVAPDKLLWIFKGVDWCGERIPGIKNLAGIIMVGAQKQ